MKNVIVIGAGLSGLALATELANEGFQVTVLEKEKYLGGRASNIIDKKTGDAVPIGPHVFVSCYNNFFKFLDTINAPRDILFDEETLVEAVHNGSFYPQKINKKLGRLYILPWIIQHPHLSWKDKLSTVKVTLKTFFLTRRSLKKLDTMTAYEYLKKNGVSDNAINVTYRFVALSLVNIPLEICSAADFVSLVNRWLSLSPLSFGFATVGLGDLYTSHAKQYLEKRKGKIREETTVKKIVVENNVIKYLLVEEKGKLQKLTADLYVSTMTPVDLRNVLQLDTRFTDFFRHLNAYEGIPYFSVNLWFDKKITDKKFWALLPISDTPPVMNTDFYDQSNIYKSKKSYSYITSNIIYSKPYANLTDDEIVEKTLAELRQTFPRMNAKLVHSRINRVPYVIYTPYPGMAKHKLSHTTPIKNFYLSGDWTVKKVQCMDTAIMSGYSCAEEMLKKYGIDKKIYDRVGL